MPLEAFKTIKQNRPFLFSAFVGGQQDQGHGVVLHIQEEVYQSTLTFRRRVAGYQE